MTDSLQALAARLAIQQALADYAYRFDARDAAGWSELFTRDGVFEYQPSDPAAQDQAFCWRGRAAIRAWAERRCEDLGPAARFLHHQSTTSFDAVAADAVASRTLLVVTRADHGTAPRISVAGVYHDQWRPTAAGWRLAHRRLVT